MAKSYVACTVPNQRQNDFEYDHNAAAYTCLQNRHIVTILCGFRQLEALLPQRLTVILLPLLVAEDIKFSVDHLTNTAAQQLHTSDSGHSTQR